MDLVAHRLLPELHHLAESAGQALHHAAHEGLDDRQRELAGWLREHGPATAGDAAAHLGVDEATARDALDGMVDGHVAARDDETDGRPTYALRPLYQELLERALRPSPGGDQMRQTLVSGMSRYVTMQVISLGLAYLTQVVLARSFGSTSYGFYSLAITLAVVLSYVASLGFPNGGLQRYVPEYVKEGSWDLFKGLLVRSVLLTLLTGAVLITLGVPGILLAPIDGLEKACFATAVVMVPFVATSQVLSGVFQSLKRWIASYFSDQVFVPAMTLVLIFGILRFGESLTAFHLVLLAFAARVMGLGVQGVWLRRTLPPAFRAAGRQDRTRQWLSTSLPLLIATLFGIIVYRADLLVVGSILGKSPAGVYAAVLTTAELFGVFLTGANQVSTPEVGPLFHKKDLASLQRLMALVARFSFFPALAGTALCAVFGRSILQVFGSGFEEGYTALLVLLAAQLLKAAMGAPTMLVVMSGHAMRIAQVYLASAVIDLVLLFVLVPSYGLLGASIASLVAMTLNQAILARLATKFTGIDPTVLARTSS